MQNAKNQIFLQQAFSNPPVILPIQNLGELSFILQKPKEAFAFLDMALKLYKHLDWDNMLQYKTLALLGVLLHTQNQNEGIQTIFNQIFKALEPHKEAAEAGECYERVFALWNYGNILSANDQTRLEGKDIIAEAADLMQKYPYWAERRMGLFAPVMTLDDGLDGL